MPVAGFICPDGQKVDKNDCLQGCRLSFPAGRCKAVPFLRRAAKDKLFDGLPSTTQLLAGTRETLIKITKPYYIDPDRKTAAIIGSGVHSLLWKLIDGEMGEETIVNDLLQGTYDMYDPQTKTLYDYKTWGVWKLAKVLSATPEERADALFEVVLQMHQYKILLKQKYPQIPIENLAIQVVSRETNLRQAEQKGLQQGSPLILLPQISDEAVSYYFEIKSEKLKLALSEDWAPLCSRRETWDTKKCQRYCDVKEICYCMPIDGSSLWKELEQKQEEAEAKILQLISQKLKEETVVNENFLAF